MYNPQKNTGDNILIFIVIILIVITDSYKQHFNVVASLGGAFLHID